MELLSHLTPHRRIQAPATSRHLAEADLTALCSLLKDVEHHQGRSHHDDAVEADLAAARVSYDTARDRLRDARRATDVTEAVAAVAVGRARLADAEARLEGRSPLAEHRPCLFDPGHGPASTEVQWTSARYGTRQVPVCARDASRMAEEQHPATRTVQIGDRRVPYWQGGDDTAPYVDGYFGTDERLAWLHPSAHRVRGGTIAPKPSSQGTDRPVLDF